MTTVICKMSDCKHRSKHPLLRWVREDGRRVYGCTLKFITIAPVLDFDGNLEQICGKDEMTKCAMYEPKGVKEEC